MTRGRTLPHPRQTANAGSRVATPSGTAPARQVNVVETLTAVGAVLAAPEALNNLLEAGERIYKYFNKADPLLCQILDSRAENGAYRVTVSLSNHTLHGVYLDRVDLVTPDVRSLTLGPAQPAAPKAAGGMSFATGAAAPAPAAAAPIPAYRPTLIAPGQLLNFSIRFVLPPPGKKPLQSGRFVFTLSRLNEERPERREITFRIRAAD